ncbi:MAG: hypothetical protein ABMA64_10685 [Myxococcota bacterium]
MRTPTPLERLAPWLLLAAIAVPRVVLSGCVTDFGADGGFYADIAKNVSQGNGLSTDVSVFHQGFGSFPHPTSVYPLWPLLYGAVAAVGPLEGVGVWLPTALYFVAVGLAYQWGRRLAPNPFVEGVPLHGGHLVGALFAVTAGLPIATSRPYTEGLAFVLLFAALLRARALWSRLGWVAGLELGGWLIALFLARSQFVVVAIAAAGALGVTALRRPREAARFGVAAVVSFGAVWAPYVAWLGTFLPDAGLGTYLRFDQARASDVLSRVPVMVEVASPADKVLDLLQGVAQAFSLGDGDSYYHLHHAAIHAVPLALLVVASRARRWRVAWRFVRTRAGADAVFANLTAVGLTASLHTVHKVYASPWVFGDRQAIPSVLLVALCALVLVRSRVALVRAAGLALVAAGVYGGWRELVFDAEGACSGTGAPYRPQLRAWIAEQHDRLGELTLAVERPEAQRLSWRTEDVGFHWMSETTTPADLGVMVRELHVAYVVVFDSLRHTTFDRDPTFLRQWVEVESFDDGAAADADEGEDRRAGRATRVYAPACAAFPGVPTCADPE